MRKQPQSHAVAQALGPLLAPRSPSAGTATKSSRSARKRSITRSFSAAQDGAGRVDEAAADRHQRRVGDHQRQLARREGVDRRPGAAASAPRGCGAASPGPSTARRRARGPRRRGATSAGSGRCPSARAPSTFDRPARRARRRSSSSFLPSVSSARTRPCPPAAPPAPASCRPRPRRRPAPARPAAAPPASATSWLPSSITSNSPSRNADSPNALTRVSNISPTGDSGVGCAITSSSASARPARRA